MGAANEIHSEVESDDEVLPRKFDRYDLLKKLATGGMAEIFLAKQSGLEGFEKVVVLKRILPHLGSDEEFVSMFLDEARIAAKLSHPNIAQIYDLGKADGTYYIAMEYVSGRNVQHMISKQQMRGEMIPVEHACRIVAGVCDGLFYAHSRKDYDGTPLNIVHRDISPQNVLVSFAGGVKVVDFGIAKASTQLAQTRAGVLKGKYAYMSPEQVRGSKVDHRSDVFAVGLVWYEMLTGHRAFERESSLKTLKAIVQEKPLNPRELNPQIPMEVVKLLSKALEKNPDKRYRTAQEMQLAIEEYLEASPKKSNNVRLSRYMYDLFEDELNSKDGTMVVKGVGEVIIPASSGLNLEPRIEEEIDHKTLTAALAPQPGPALADGAVRVVQDERSAPKLAAKSVGAQKDAGAKEPLKEALREPPREKTPPRPAALAPADSDDDDDGRTIPATDLDELERKRALKRGAALSGPATDAEASAELASSAADAPFDEANDDAVGDGSDKTAAGIEPVVLPPPKRGRGKEADDRAVALLAKVEAMAAADEAATRTAVPAPHEPVEGRRAAFSDAGSAVTDELSAKPSMVVGPNGRVEPAGAVRPAGRPQQTPSMVDGATSDTPPPGNVRGGGDITDRAPAARRVPSRAPSRPQTPSPAATLPKAVYVAVAATIVMCVASIAGLVVIWRSVSTTTLAEYAIVNITTEPPGAVVTVNGDAALSGKAPVQIPVEKGAEHLVEVKLDGHAPQKKSVKVAAEDVVEVSIALSAE